MELCKTGTRLRLEYLAVHKLINPHDPRLEMLYYGTPEQVRQVRAAIAAEIAEDNRRPEVAVAKAAYDKHITECERCRTD